MLAAVCVKYLEISKVQIKLTLLVNSAVAVLLAALAPMIFGIKNLDAIAASFVLERFVSLSGIILLTPLFFPEQSKNISELVESKYTSPTCVYFVRIFLSIISLAAIICVFVLIMRAQACEFDTAMFAAGTFATAFFLGAMGFATYGITDNIVAGYLLPLGYYMINMFSGSGRLKSLYLFSLSKNSFNEKYWLIFVGSVLIAITLLYKHIVIRKR